MGDPEIGSLSFCSNGWSWSLFKTKELVILLCLCYTGKQATHATNSLDDVHRASKHEVSISQAEIAKIMKQQQQQQYDDTKHTENKPATTVRVSLRDFVSCEPLISFLRVCLIFSTYILKLMAYASYESSIIVVQQARQGWRSKSCMEDSCRKEQLQHSKKLWSRQTQGWCNQITCPYVDDLFSHQLRFCSLFLSLSTESTIFFSSWVAPSRNFGTDFLIFSLQQEHRNSLLTWCYSDFFQQIKLLMFKQTSQQKRGQQKWEWYTQSLRLGEKSVSCTKLACKTVRNCR